jgi:serine phosphatase RsbU (regulator of sigma subunit)
MDVCLCFIEPQENKLSKIYFSGAKRPLYHLSKGVLTEHKGTKKSIGGHIGSAESDFFSTEIFAQSGEIIYLTTDGYADQANENRQKFSSQKLKNLLEEVGNFPLHEQEILLKNALHAHQGNAAQRDDITIAGILIA